LWTLQNTAGFLMQISPLLFMVLLSLVSTLFISDPAYSLVPDTYVFSSSDIIQIVTDY